MNLIEMFSLLGVIMALGAVIVGVLNLLSSGRLYDSKYAVLRLAASIVAYIFTYIALVSVISVDSSAYLIYTLCWNIAAYSVAFSGIIFIIEILFMLRDSASQFWKLKKNTNNREPKFKF